MSLVISDRVKETTTTTGTGTLTLGGALGGFQTFSDAIGSGNTTYYVIENDAQYEIGIGTCGGDSLSRDTVLRSSNSDAKISLTGVSFVFCVIPADRSIFKDVDGNFIISGDISTDDIFADGSLVVKGDVHASGDISTDGDLSAGSVSVADLSTSGNIIVNDLRASGQILSSGLLTLVRTGAGCFAHAFVDGNNQTIALHTDGDTSPEWKLGLKTDQSETAAPTTAYIIAKDGDIGFYANSSNHLDLDHGNGFTITNQGDTTFVSSSATGNYAVGNTASYPSFVVKAAVSQSDNIQEWQNSSELTLASVSNDGSIHTSGNISASGGILLNDVVPNSITNKLYNDGGSLFFNGSALGGDAKNVDVLANSASGVAISGYIDYVAGSGSDLTISSGNANLALISANTTEMRAADEANAASGVAISGWAGSTFLTSAPSSGEVDANSASGVAISGWASHTIDATGLYVRGLALDNTTEIRTNSASGVAISGWAAYRVDANASLISDNTINISVSGNRIETRLEADIRANSASGVVISGIASDAASSANVLANSASGVAISGYNQAYTDIKVAALIDGAPATLDTLNEIAAAINDDANIATTLTNSISANTTEIRANSASGTNHAADIIRNSASGTATNTSVTNLTTELRTESASGLNHANDIIRLAASGTNNAADIARNSASGDYTSSVLSASGVNITNSGIRFPNPGNSEYVEMGFSSNSFIINTVANGGTARNIVFQEDGGNAGYYDAASNAWRISRNFYPDGDASVRLGWQTLRWSIGYFDQLDQEIHTASDVGHVIKGHASQSANLSQWQANDGTIVAYVDEDGSIATSGDIGVSGDITSNGRIFLPAGSVGAPSITFTGGASKRVGIYEPVADSTIGFVTGGGTRLAIRSKIITATSEGGYTFTNDGSNPHSATVDTYIKRYDAGEVGIYNDNGTTLGDLVVSGVYASGVVFADHVPVSTTNALYNEGGTLKFNGSAVGGGGGTTYTAGSGLILQDDVFHLSFGSGNVNRDYTTAVSGYLDFAIGSGADFTISSGQKAYDLAVALAIDSGNKAYDTAVAVAIDSGNKAYDTAVAVTISSGNALEAEIRANSASGIGGPSGVAFFDDYGVLTSGNELIFDSTDCELFFKQDGSFIQFEGSDGNKALKLGNSADSATNAGKIFFYLNNSTIATMQVGSAGLVQELNNTDDAIKFRDGNNDDVFIIEGGDEAYNTITTAAGATKIPHVIKGAASQSADLLQLQDNSSVVFAKVGPLGSFTASGDITTSGNIITSGVLTSGVHLQPIAPALSGYPVTNVLYNDNGTLKFNGSAVGGGGSARSVSGDTDNAIITWNTSDDTFVAESTFLYDGSTVSLSGDMTVDGNITLGSSGTLISSGVASSGLRLGTYTPLETNETLYNDAGTLKFNGSAVGLDHAINSGQKAYDLAVAVAVNSGNLNDAAIDALTVELRTESASGAIHAADILANSASGVSSPSGLAFFGGGPAVSDNGHLTQSADLVIESGQNRIYMHPPGANEVVKIGWNGDKDEFLINTVENGGTVRNVSFAVGGTSVFTLNAANSRMVIAGDMYPDNDAGRELGSSTKRWENIYTDQLNAHCHTASDVCVQVKAHASQSANVQSWRTNGGTEFVGIGPDGGIVLPDNTPSSTTNKLYNNGGTLTFNGSAVGGGGGMSNFILEDDSGDEVTISDGKEVKFIGDGVTINWTDTSDGSDSDPYDLTFTLDTVSVAKGGTNATSFADKSVIISQDSGTDTLAAAQMDGNGELLIGGTSGPAVANLTSSDSSIDVTNGNGTLSVQTAGGGGVPSDTRLKENATELENCLEMVEKLVPMSFDWNEIAADIFKKEGSDIGLMAQDVEEIVPEAINQIKGYKTVNYAKLTVLLINAIKELKQEVEDLKSTPN